MSPKIQTIAIAAAVAGAAVLIFADNAEGSVLSSWQTSAKIGGAVVVGGGAAWLLLLLFP